MLPTERALARANRVASASVVPALRKLREERGTHFCGSVNGPEWLGHLLQLPPPENLVNRQKLHDRG